MFFNLNQCIICLLYTSFQNIRLFNDLTVLDNVRIALHKDVRYPLPVSYTHLDVYKRQVYPAEAFAVTNYNVMGLTLSSKDIFVFISAVVLMIILQYIIKRTKTGKAMRAVSLDKDAAMLMGISVDKTISITFAIGSALAAAAGVMIGVYYLSLIHI